MNTAVLIIRKLNLYAITSICNDDNIILLYQFLLENFNDLNIRVSNKGNSIEYVNKNGLQFRISTKTKRTLYMSIAIWNRINQKNIIINYNDADQIIGNFVYSKYKNGKY